MFVCQAYFALIVRIFLWVILVTGGSAALAQHSIDATLKVIQGILDMPEKQIDLAKAKLSIDRMIDPSVDVEGALKQLDAMASEIRAKLPPGASSRDKLETLRTYIYQAGPWNGNRPFSYDLRDPFGRSLKNKLLTTYLSTRKGNCVSMPLLFVILGQKIGLDVTLSTAPEHIFVKYRDESGTLYNLETTSGAGFTRDVWMQQQLPMTDQALANGVYMQPLDNKHAVVVVAEVLSQFYSDQRDQEQASIALAELQLKYYPKFVDAMLHISAAHWRIRQSQFVSKYLTPNDIPVSERARFVEVDQNIALWRRKAVDLGWFQPL